MMPGVLGPFFATSPYLHLQWRLIALDWLYQRHFCFLPGIHWRNSASSIHGAPSSQSAVIKFVFLSHFFHHSFFFFFIEWKSRVWSLEDVLHYRAQQKVQQEVNNGKQHRRRDWGFSEVLYIFLFLRSLLSLFETMEWKTEWTIFRHWWYAGEKEFVAQDEKGLKR